MLPVIFSHPTWYVLWTFAAVVGTVFNFVMLRRAGVSKWAAVVVLSAVPAAGVLGAKLLHAVENGIPLAEFLQMGGVGGFRMPGGLIGMIVILAALCPLLRVSALTVLDAMVPGVMLTIAIGRLGCFLSGCCFGHPTDLPWGVIYPEESDAQLSHRMLGWIGPDATASLPVHPLSLYFAIDSLVIMVVLLWLTRRGRPRGDVFLWFLVLRGSSKFALEQLRGFSVGAAVNRSGEVELWMAIAASLVLLTLSAIRSTRTRSVAATVLLLGLTGVARAAEPAMTPDEKLRDALDLYVQDQRAGARALRHAVRAVPTPPPVYLMALADAELRRGRTRAATRLFQTVVDRAPGEPWNGWAELALASLEHQAGEAPDARVRLERLTDTASPSAPVATMLLGLLDVEAGDDASAAARFGAVVAAPAATPALRQAARLGLGYLLYWQSRYAAAAQAFDGAVATAPASALADDARYAAAWSRSRDGDRTAALAALQALAPRRPASSGRRLATPELVRLDRESVVREGFDRYRRGKVGDPRDMAAGMFDGDGPALAWAALALIERPDGEPSSRPAADGWPHGVTRPVEVTPGSADRSADAAPQPRHEPSVAARAVDWTLVGLGLLVAVLAVQSARRNTARRPPSPRR